MAGLACDRSCGRGGAGRGWAGLDLGAGPGLEGRNWSGSGVKGPGPNPSGFPTLRRWVGGAWSPRFLLFGPGTLRPRWGVLYGLGEAMGALGARSWCTHLVRFLPPPYVLSCSGPWPDPFFSVQPHLERTVPRLATDLPPPCSSPEWGFEFPC